MPDIICKKCFEHKKHKAKGLCLHCYRDEHYQRPEVKERRKKYDRLYKAEHREEAIAYAKGYKEKNQEKVKDNIDRWKKNNKDKIKGHKKQYRETHKDKIKGDNKNYRKGHKEEFKTYILKYVKDRKSKDINFKLRCNIRTRIHHALKLNLKSQRTMNLIGCSIPELKQHLENQFTLGMNWKNYGFGWHIDHILPCSSFNLVDEEEQRKCFCFENLQPLWASDNLSKGGVKNSTI